jgi:hypothetical protein
LEANFTDLLFLLLNVYQIVCTNVLAKLNNVFVNYPTPHLVLPMGQVLLKTVGDWQQHVWALGVAQWIHTHVHVLLQVEQLHSSQV